MNTDQPLQIRVYRRRELCHTLTLDGELQIGRQRPGEPAPFHLDTTHSRLVIAPVDDKLVSREHLLLTAIRSDEMENRERVRIKNLSRKRSVVIDTHGKLGPEQFVELDLPVLISFDDFAVRIEAQGSAAWELRSLEHPTLAPGDPAAGNSLVTQQSFLAVSAKEEYSADQLIHWLGETMEVLQSAAGASDFLVQAVDAVERIVGLDTITALRYERNQWSVVTAKDRLANQVGSDTRSPSRTILQEVLEKRRTVFHLPAGSRAAVSLQGVKALVASPILDAQGNVIGALYGARHGSQTSQLPQISELEATMVEVIACSAAAGIARELQQQKALQARIQFEQFFTPQLARELEANPHLLDGQDAEISVLFCDIVGFSSISSRIGSQLTLEWISDVMDHLSVAVLENDGVVVDYIGDELMAMWGAPKPERDHALKACRAANALMNCKQKIDELWSKRIEANIDFRIGICSGVASVGNTGSKRRLKYGPLGNTVNLASRLQNAAKQFGVQQLISQETAIGIRSPNQRAINRDSAGPDSRGTDSRGTDSSNTDSRDTDSNTSDSTNTDSTGNKLSQAADALVIRPLGTAQFVNIPNPIEVYELCPAPQKRPELISAFEKIVRQLQAGETELAQAELSRYMSQCPDDATAQLLAAKIESGSFAPECIWRFDTK